MYDLNGQEVWFEIPRSCSVTVKESFPKRKQVFRDTPEYKEWYGKKPIVIISDPIIRFISCINAYLTPGQRYYHYGGDIFQTAGVSIENCSKADRVKIFFENLHLIESQHQVHHFHPQSTFVDTKNFNEFKVLRRYQINQFFGINGKFNVTKKEITEDDLTKDQYELVKNYYKSDYQFLKKYG